MTRGNPLVLIIQFSLPILLGNLFQQTYNMVDAIIVGKVLGTSALASVGASASVQFLVLGFCFGFCAGFGVPVAQRFGAGDYSGMRQYIFHGVCASAGIALVLTTVCAIFTPQILHLLRTTDDIFENARIYLLIIFLGIPFCILYNFLAGILRAVGDSRTPFVFLVISASLNIGLDLLFIICFKWGCAGAAIATVLSQAISGILCLILIVLKYDILKFKPGECRWSTTIFHRLISMGLPMGLQFSITAIGSMIMQASNNALGSLYVSAFTAGSKLKQFAMCPFDALASAVATFAAQNYGAGNIPRIRKGLWQGVFIGVTYGAIIGLVLILFGRPLSTLFVPVSESAVLDASGKYARCLGYFYWVIGILNTMRLTTQGLGFSNRAIFSGVSELVARALVSLIFVPVFGFTAICFCDQTAWIFASLYITPTCLLCIRKIERELKDSRIRHDFENPEKN